jgi:hypothetical protein
MKLTAKALLEGGSAKPFEVDSLTSREFVDLLDSHKALLFQGAKTVEDFGEFVTSLQLESYPYVGGAAPRTIIPVSSGKDIIFTANERYRRDISCTLVSKHDCSHDRYMFY